MYDETMKKTVSLGQKIDIVLTLIRIGFFYGDQELTQSNLTKVWRFYVALGLKLLLLVLLLWACVSVC